MSLLILSVSLSLSLKPAVSWLIWVVCEHHVQQLSERVQGDVKVPRALPGEEGGDGEAGADGGEVVIRVHRTAVWKVGAWTQER